MRDLLGQIEIAVNSGLYYLALMGSLSIPDICGAIESPNGWAKPNKYKKWFNQYVAPKYKDMLTGEDCYYFRCSLLHQGSSQNPNSRYSRIFFIEPSVTRNIYHCNKVNDALNIDVRIFCKDVISGALSWLDQHEGTALFRKNYDKCIRRYPNGIPGFVPYPVIG
jgi:hypothetical protein